MGAFVGWVYFGETRGHFNYFKDLEKKMSKRVQALLRFVNNIKELSLLTCVDICETLKDVIMNIGMIV